MVIRYFRDIYTVQLYQVLRRVSTDSSLSFDTNPMLDTKTLLRSSVTPKKTLSGEYFLGEIPGAFMLFILLFFIGQMKRYVNSPKDTLITFIYMNVLAGILMIVVNILYTFNQCSQFWWIAVVGIGVYMSYGLVGAPMLEQVFAISKQSGTINFLILLIDGFGSMGVIGMLLYKVFVFDSNDVSTIHEIFKTLVYLVAIILVLCQCGLFIFFRQPSVPLDGVKNDERGDDVLTGYNPIAEEVEGVL